MSPPPELSQQSVLDSATGPAHGQDDHSQAMPLSTNILSGSINFPSNAPASHNPYSEALAAQRQEHRLFHDPIVSIYGSRHTDLRPAHGPFDTTGQKAPPGMKPKVTVTLWEDEGTLAFQVVSNGVIVARREDNHFVNGTKLLEAAGTRQERRDAMLRSELSGHVIEVGPVHLRGVWVPIYRALDFANLENITDSLYPLFVHNIGGLLYHPENASTTGPIATPHHQQMSTDDATWTGSGMAPDSDDPDLDLNAPATSTLASDLSSPQSKNSQYKAQAPLTRRESSSSWDDVDDFDSVHWEEAGIAPVAIPIADHEASEACATSLSATPPIPIRQQKAVMPMNGSQTVMGPASTNMQTHKPDYDAATIEASPELGKYLFQLRDASLGTSTYLDNHPL